MAPEASLKRRPTALAARTPNVPSKIAGSRISRMGASGPMSQIQAELKK